jgi:hypothetical protein
MTELEELKAELQRAFPKGFSNQSAREKRIHHLHEQIIKRLVMAVKDTYSHHDLAEMYLDEAFGDELARPRIVLTEDFQEMWKDLLLDDDSQEIAGE